jgi:hypothetical protein
MEENERPGIENQGTWGKSGDMYQLRVPWFKYKRYDKKS